MCGDAAGLITPLCGNGMAMAIHGAALAAQLVHEFLTKSIARPELEARYRRHWHQLFGTRLRVGRAVQGLFGHPILSEALVRGMGYWPAGVQLLMRRTHGQSF
jgi:flavin-dependent dehydrogenase